MIKQELEWYNVNEQLPPVDEDVLGAWYEYNQWNFLMVSIGNYSNTSPSSKQFDSIVDAGCFPPVEYWAYLKPLK